MNREELAALLAQTHSTQHSSRSAFRPPSSPTSPMRSQWPSRDPTSPLSPRQIFQSRVRTLSDEDTSTKQPPSPIRRSHELHHLSSLRVHVQDSDTLSNPVNIRCPRQYRSKDGRFGFSPAEPDFLAEERAAWNRDRPHKIQDQRGSFAFQEDGNLRQGNSSTHNLHSEEDESLQRVPTLRPFGPGAEPGNPDERPKTSRGPNSTTDSISGAYPAEETRSNAHASRRSKFLEGSMTERSVGTASTWDKNALRLSESSERIDDADDSDATPRASRASRDSGSSFDVSEFRPRPTTPATIKGKLSKLVKRSSEDTSKSLGDDKKPKKKGLRKSISTWSFHNIGDKMKFFGASSADLSEEPHLPKQGQTTQLAELNERKRKAEEAYAQQFGMKKQKSNDGIPVQDSQGLRTLAQPRTLKKRPLSERTMTPATATRRQREVSGSTSRSIHDPADIVSDSDHDHRKRPSRSELEKENQQLRAMLRERQAQKVGVMHRSASKSDIHLPIDDDNHVPATRSASRSISPGRSSAAPAKSTKQKQVQSKGVPPVPALPSRAILASLCSNGRNAGPPADTGTMKRVKGGFPRPVSMILEEDGENDQGETTVQSQKKSPTPMSPQPPTTRDGGLRKETWEWPDDVF